MHFRRDGTRHTLIYTYRFIEKPQNEMLVCCRSRHYSIKPHAYNETVELILLQQKLGDNFNEIAFISFSDRAKPLGIRYFLFLYTFYAIIMRGRKCALLNGIHLNIKLSNDL